MKPFLANPVSSYRDKVFRNPKNHLASTFLCNFFIAASVPARTPNHRCVPIYDIPSDRADRRNSYSMTELPQLQKMVYDPENSAVRRLGDKDVKHALHTSAVHTESSPKCSGKSHRDE